MTVSAAQRNALKAAAAVHHAACELMTATIIGNDDERTRAWIRVKFQITRDGAGHVFRLWRLHGRLMLAAVPLADQLPEARLVLASWNMHATGLAATGYPLFITPITEWAFAMISRPKEAACAS